MRSARDAFCGNWTMIRKDPPRRQNAGKLSPGGRTASARGRSAGGASFAAKPAHPANRPGTRHGCLVRAGYVPDVPATRTAPPKKALIDRLFIIPPRMRATDRVRLNWRHPLALPVAVLMVLFSPVLIVLALVLSPVLAILSNKS